LPEFEGDDRDRQQSDRFDDGVEACSAEYVSGRVHSRPELQCRKEDQRQPAAEEQHRDGGVTDREQ
jgi:hypothetical protein